MTPTRKKTAEAQTTTATSRRRRKPESPLDWDDRQDLLDEQELELDADEAKGRDPDGNDADDDDAEDEDLVEVRIAVGPDGVPEALTFPFTEDEEAPFIERDEKLEQEIEWEAKQPLDKVIDEWDDPSATSDPVRMYLHEIGRTALLSSEEEVTLANQIRQGKEAGETLRKDGDLDLDTRDRLVVTRESGRISEQRLAQANLRLVVSVAKRYVGRGMSFLDLIQEGNIGLTTGGREVRSRPWASSSAPTPPGGSARRSAGRSPTRLAPSASPCTWWRASTARSALSAG